LFVGNVDEGKISFETSKYISAEAHHELTRRCPIEVGDVLYTIVGSYGNAAVVRDSRPFSFQRHIAHLKPQPARLTGDFLAMTLHSDLVRRQVDQLVRGVAQKTLNLTELKAIEVPVPPLAEQRRIAEVLDRAEALRAKRRAALVQLDTLSQAIFFNLFGDPALNSRGWLPATLGDVIFSASDGPHVSPKYSETGVPFLSTRHVRAGAISSEDLKFISPEDAEIHWRKCKPERGDILYTKGGTTGLAAMVRTDDPFAIWVHVALLKPDPRKVDSTWLEAMLNGDFCYRQSQVLTRGIANRDLGLTRMIHIEMILPPLALQQDFARRIAAVEKLKATHRASLAELDALFASLQHRAFRGEL
jgi:type I restriction enzyme S subunit